MKEKDKGSSRYSFFILFKGTLSYFEKFSVLFHLKKYYSKVVTWKFQLKLSSDLYFVQRIFICRTEFANGFSFCKDVKLIK